MPVHWMCCWTSVYICTIKPRIDISVTRATYIRVFPRENTINNSMGVVKCNLTAPRQRNFVRCWHWKINAKWTYSDNSDHQRLGCRYIMTSLAFVTDSGSFNGKGVIPAHVSRILFSCKKQHFLDKITWKVFRTIPRKPWGTLHEWHMGISQKWTFWWCAFILNILYVTYDPADVSNTADTHSAANTQQDIRSQDIVSHSIELVRPTKNEDTYILRIDIIWKEKHELVLHCTKWLVTAMPDNLRTYITLCGAWQLVRLSSLVTSTLYQTRWDPMWREWAVLRKLLPHSKSK